MCLKNRDRKLHLRKRLNLKFACLIWIACTGSTIAYGQQGNEAYPGYQNPSYYQPAAPTYQLAQIPNTIQPQNNYQLPPPTTYSNPQPTYGYDDPNRESQGIVFQYPPNQAYSQQPESVYSTPATDKPDSQVQQNQESESELVIAESLGPAVDQDSWIHGSWKSFCQTGCIAGIEGTFLSIQNDNLRSIEAIDLINNQTIQGLPQDGFGAGYRTWIGMQSGAVGFRITYWSFENSFFQPSPIFIPQNSFAFYDSNLLRAQTLDIEFLQRFCFHQSWLETSLGARYASLDRAGLLQGTGKLGGVNLLGSSATNSDLEGWGGVASIGGWIPIFCKEDLAPGCYHPWSLFWKCQGAALQAQSKIQAITLVNAIPGNDKFATAYSKDEAIADWDGMIGMGMLQIGLDYRCPTTWIDCQPAALHLRSGFEGQYWQTGDIGVRSQSAATLAGDFNGSEFGGAIQAHADTNPQDLVLLGFFISASLSY